MNCFIIYMFFIIKASCTQLSKKLKTPNNCADDEFFDIIALDCVNCVLQDNLIAYQNIKTTNSNLVRSEDGITCKCMPGFYQSWSTRRMNCVQCPFDTATSLNGLHCSTCSSDSPFDSNRSICTPCNETSIRREIIINNTSTLLPSQQSCYPCPNNSRPDSDGVKCIPCHHSLIECKCPSDHFTLYGGICLPNSELIIEKVDLYLVSYDNGEKVKSAHFVDNFQSSVYNCHYATNRTACQVLANLCTLLNYNLYDANIKTITNACTELLKLSKLPIAPFLIYSDSAPRELYNNVLKKRYKINSKLEFIAARYDANGNLIEYSPLRVGELQLCKGQSEELESGFFIGTNYNQNCLVNAKDIWETASNEARTLIFYDLFLLDSEDDVIDDHTIYPVPVLISNLRINGEYVNQDEDENKWQLVRRFYLSEALTGIELKSTANNVEFSDNKIADQELRESQLVRYARNIKIEVKMNKKDGSGLIYPPLIRIDYGILMKDDIEVDKKISINFRIDYSMDQSKNIRDFTICLCVFPSFAVLIALFRTWSWTRRSGKVDLLTVAQFILKCANFISYALIIVAIGFAINAFVIYKRQSVIYGMLPTQSQESAVKICVYIAFAFKVISVFHDLVILSHTNIFLIDWERPRVIQIAKKAKSEENQDSKGPKKASLLVSGGVGLASGKNGQEKLLLAQFPAISIWRTYFVANEYIKLCTFRKINTHLHMFLVVLFLYYFENLTSSDTNNNIYPTSAQRYVPKAETCRLAISSIVYLSLAILQIVIKNIIYEKMFHDKLNEFVDLCSVSNISLFCLLYQRFGYYIHGRSPNGKADVNMKEMHELMKREEDDLCSKRGLVPNTEQQTFEMSLPSAVNDQYNRIRCLLTSYSQGADRMQGIGGKLSRVDVEKVVPTYLMLNKFISAFIEHSFKDLDYTVKDKSNLELILDFELLEPREKGFLYNDNGHSFQALFFAGIEWDLILFELMLFIHLDLMFDNFVIAAIITCLIIDGIKGLYTLVFRNNLARKALIDERFLM